MTDAPELPGISCEEDASEAYLRMFAGCTALSAAPSILPLAVIRGAGIYNSTFYGCTALSVAPPMLLSSFEAYANWDCNAMYQNCTNLRTPPPVLLPTYLPRQAPYADMFKNCTSLTSAPEICATSTANSYTCWGMFYGCNKLLRGPSHLRLTGVSYSAYSGMFYGCTSLTAAPIIHANTISQTGCY